MGVPSFHAGKSADMGGNEVDASRITSAVVVTDTSAPTELDDTINMENTDYPGDPTSVAVVENAAYTSNPGEPTTKVMVENAAYTANPGEPITGAMVGNAACISNPGEPTAEAMLLLTSLILESQLW